MYICILRQCRDIGKEAARVSRLRTVRLRGIARTLKINGTKGNPARVFVARTRSVLVPDSSRPRRESRFTRTIGCILINQKTTFVHLPSEKEREKEREKPLAS